MSEITCDIIQMFRIPRLCFEAHQAVNDSMRRKKPQLVEGKKSMYLCFNKTRTKKALIYIQFFSFLHKFSVDPIHHLKNDGFFMDSFVPW